MNTEVKKLLEAVRAGETSVEDALLMLKTAPYTDIGYAKLDLHRGVRQGVPEVIYGAGKTAVQIAGIINALSEHGQKRILITRLSAENAEKLSRSEEHTSELQSRE